MAVVLALSSVQQVNIDDNGNITNGKSYAGSGFKQPTTYRWMEEDISADGAGRSIDYTMHKLKVGTVEKIELSWKGLSNNEIKKLLEIFGSQTYNGIYFTGEYFKISYLCPKTGTHATKYFYIGNRTAPLYNSTLGVWDELSFNMIQQNKS